MAEDRPRLPLIATSTNRARSITQDARLVNGYVEKDALGETWVYKRPGYFLAVEGAAGVGRGLYNYIGNLFHIAGNKLYNGGVEKGTVASSGDPFVFIETNYSSPFFIKNDTDAYVYDGAASLTAVADADYPATTAYGAAHLDGTVYVMDVNGNVFGSVIDDPTSWDPTNVIVAQNEAGDGIALVKLLSFVVAMKAFSIQFFYNAGNATGSPLARYDGPNLNIGCRNALSVQVAEDKLFWIGQSKAGGPFVMLLDKLAPSKISTPAVDRLLIASGVFSVRSFLLRVSGHLLYGLKLSSPSIAIVYDYTEKIWYQWTGTDDAAWPIVEATGLVSHPVVQHATDGCVYTLSDNNYLDDGDLFSWDLYAPNYDGGVRVRKTLHQMDFVGDQVSGSLLQVRHNEDDYATNEWTPYRTVDLSVPRPFIRDEGTFYRRAYHLHHRRNTPLRLQFVELDIEPGYF